MQVLRKKNLCSWNASTFASRHESGVVLDRLASWQVSLKCISSLVRTTLASPFHLLVIIYTFCVFFSSIQLIGTDYSTQNCECRIKDVACLGWCVVNTSHAQILFDVLDFLLVTLIFFLILCLYSFLVEMSLVIMWRFHASRVFVLVTTAIFGCFTQVLFIPWKD